MRKILGLLFAVGLMAGTVSANFTIVDVDNTTTNLIPTYTLEGDVANAGGSAARWGSVTITNTDFIGVTADPATSTDVYVQWAGIAVPVADARYLQIHYSVDGAAFTGDAHRVYVSTTDQGFGGVNITDDNLIPGTTGSHSFILDMESHTTTYSGNWTQFRWDMWNETSLTINAGKQITIDKIVWGDALGTVTEAYYVAATRTDWTDAAAWSDGNPATAGILYYATNSSVVLETPATTATFPGDLLSLSDQQRLEVMVSGADVITIDGLVLDDADLGAGVGTGEAKIDGKINVSSDSVFSGAIDNSRELRVLSQVIAGSSVSVELAAPTKTIYIDNPTNDISGTWVVSSGTAEFTSNSVGSAAIDVQSNGTLRIVGDWNGRDAGSDLTVADSPFAQVDLGTYDWTVGVLTIGGANIDPGDYTAVQLNAFASNAVFTGSGTLSIGFQPKTYYLHANIPASKWIGEQEWWYDDPVGGNQMHPQAPFTGSTFDVNGYAWRSKNQNPTATFTGLLVVNDTIGSGLYSAYCGDQRLNGGMILSNSVTARPHRSPAGTYVSDLQTGPSGVFLFRTLINAGTTNKIQNLSLGTISGNGEIQFGGNQSYDPIGIWSLAVTETCTNFTGTIDLREGELTFDSEVLLPNASFVVGEGDNSVVLSNDVVFASLVYGLTVLSDGTYTAAELNSTLFTDRFYGDGTVSFEITTLPLVAPLITDITVSGADVMISGTSSNVNANGEYRLQSSTELVAPGWSPVETNTFDENGDFSVTTPLTGATEEFYRLEVN